MLPFDTEPNRLIHEKSPYLQQHAYNPVDWHPWGEEAFAKARQEDKPVFLSIGYSTCHWCHVMEEESFEDNEVADRLNKSFVAIKVDREERPDIDGIYMTVCQMMNGSGGWPLNLLLTPDKKPFFAGTYFPKNSRPPQIGLIELLIKVEELWSDRRDELLASADSLVGLLKRGQGGTHGSRLGPSVLDHAFNGLTERFDPEYGGFRPAPKFPSPHTLIFLLRYWKRTSNKHALDMVCQTLSAMRLGGLFDHVGFGFHRYSTDEEWLLPHFEKMLYDQALLALAYTEGFLATGNELFARTACEVFTYVQRDLCSMEGGFYCAEDADSEGVEGKFYVWTEEELEDALDPEQAALAKRMFNTAPEGNFREERSGRMTGDNILHLTHDGKVALDVHDKDSPPLSAQLEVIRENLFICREARVRPGLDDKILTDWNGLMIAALALGGRVFGRESYLRAAAKAVDFIFDNMRDDQGRLLHRYREGEAAVLALFDDYAFLIWGLIELYQSDFKPRWLRKALDLSAGCVERFWDLEYGGFFVQPEDGETVLIRQKEIYDGAMPSGNSVMYLNLLRLARLTGNNDLAERAADMHQAFSGTVAHHPGGFLHFLTGLDTETGPSGQLVVVGEAGLADTDAMLHVLHTSYAPHIDVVYKDPKNSAAIDSLSNLTHNRTTTPGTATAYLCLDKTCHPPLTDPEALRELLLSTGKRDE